MNHYQERNYRVKKPRDLQLSKIKSQETANIEMLIQRIKRNNMAFLIFCPFIILILSAGLFDAIKKSQEVDIVIRGTILVILFTCFIKVIREVVGARLDNIVGAQYGIVKRAYTARSGTIGEARRRRQSYVDVEFPKEHSFMKHICYSGQRYFPFNEGDDVLVISFNGKEHTLLSLINKT